ncbi:predicted protein [Streptomyces sp. SPB78]|uniref:hypothetical protein n=1 Tax=Streptomyces sp. (strain SPB78) TaxID=591157 RepID=UPI0001DED61A|nr:hypothetical protein [Streptomyces sp. SPB78]EFK97961.1 predicted protein [Streptomyces sp. SPB78]
MCCGVGDLLLRYAGGSRAPRQHPLARAVVDAATRCLDIPPVRDSVSVPGTEASTAVGKTVVVGNSVGRRGCRPLDARS